MGVIMVKRVKSAGNIGVFAKQDNFIKYTKVASECLFDNCSNLQPVVTIAIPTYKRHDLLIRAILSAKNQNTKICYEIVIVDNDPMSNFYFNNTTNDLFLGNVRVFRNKENIGMFGNWNRCIELARGEWVTILNDDDILYPNYLETVFRKFHTNETIDGLVCWKAKHLNIPHEDSSLQGSNESDTYIRRLKKMISRLRSPSNLFRINFKFLYFGNSIGNGLGFIFKRKLALELGGYNEKYYPSSDYYFYVSFSYFCNLVLLKEVLVSVGYGVNESLNPDVVVGFIEKDYALRNDIDKLNTPIWFRLMSKRILEKSLSNFKAQSNQHLYQINTPKVSFKSRLRMLIQSLLYLDPL